MENMIMPVTSGLYSDDQEALNKMTIDRINGMIERKSPDAKEALENLINEGKVQRDFIAPIGVTNRNAEPAVHFASNGKVKMIFNNGEYEIHENAIVQLASRMGVPTGYLRGLSTGDEWKRNLAAEILNEHMGWTERQRVLIRSVGNEVRGVLSDRYRRLNSMNIVMAFMEQVQASGGVLVNGAKDATKFWFETIYPNPMIIPTAKNGLVSLAFGARLSSSDFGDGSLQLRSFILQGVCTNGLVRESVVKQIHLGGRLPDNIALSERTYRYDTMTMASAIKDTTKILFEPETVKQKAIEIQKASEMDVDFGRELKRLQRDNLTKAEVNEVESVLMNSNPDDGVAGEATLWKLVNGITAIAREKDVRRERELQEIAGDLMSRVTKN